VEPSELVSAPAVSAVDHTLTNPGLFVGSGAALGTGGPVGAWLAYIIMAIMVYSMMIALGEMGSLIPTSGAFTHYCARFVDPALGFATGINYWCECHRHIFESCLRIQTVGQLLFL
jgi:amino acid permease